MEALAARRSADGRVAPGLHSNGAHPHIGAGDGDNRDARQSERQVWRPAQEAEIAPLAHNHNQEEHEQGQLIGRRRGDGRRHGSDPRILVYMSGTKKSLEIDYYLQAPIGYS